MEEVEGEMGVGLEVGLAVGMVEAVLEEGGLHIRTVCLDNMLRNSQTL